MYSSINLVFYAEKESGIPQKIRASIISCDAPFKELRSLGLLFSAIKNPLNYAIILVKSKEFLTTLQTLAKTCHDYQSRIFIVHNSPETIDGFFENFCLSPKLDTLKQFIINAIPIQELHPQNQPSKLLSKLVKLELENLDISKKYVGFKYLIDLIVNALCKHCYSNNYIDLFEYVASINLASIDTIERDVRHMLLTTWKNSLKFKETLQKLLPNNDNPNSKTLLKAIISYLKNAI